MRSRVFIQVAIAALAAMPSAYAAIDVTATGPASANLSDPPGTEVVLAVQSTTNPSLENAPAAGGALFSPFAMAPEKPARREPETASYQSTGNADLTFSVAAALAALAAFAHLLRRASS